MLRSADARSGPHTPVQAVYRTVRAHQHVAVVDGPDTGWVAPVDGAGVVIGRSARADLTVGDDLLSRRHLRLRQRGGRAQVQDLGSTNGTRLRAVRRRRNGRVGPGHQRRTRRVTRRWLRLRAGDLLLVGATVLQIRDHPALAFPAPAGRERGEPLTARLIFPVLMSAGMIPIVLHSGTGWWRLVLVLAMPLGLILGVLWPALAQRARRQRSGGTLPAAGHAPGAGTASATGTAAVLDSARVATDRADPSATVGSGAAVVDGYPMAPDPAALLVRAMGRPEPAAATHWDLGTAGQVGTTKPGRRRRPRHISDPALVPIPAPGDGLVLVGACADTAALSRYLICQTQVHAPPGHWRIDADMPWLGDLAPAGEQGGGRDDARDDGQAGGTRVLRVLDVGQSPGPEGPGGTPGAAADPGPAPHLAPGAEQVVPGPAAEPGVVHLILARHLGQVPPWCSRIVEVPAGHDRRVSDQWARTVTTVWAQAVCAATTANQIPQVVPLQELLGAAVDIAQNWCAADTGLGAPIGRDANGPVMLDLVQAGPHAVVAGTTGSGKSELLLAWALSLAAHYPPGDLAFLLVDYKGGATFSPIATLPHVVGMLTDLDASTTARALASLRAELHRRERILARAQAANLAEYRRARRTPAGNQVHSGRTGQGEPLPRLMVIVDEFRVLADEHPEQLDALVRLAAQGRSLGIHLVLATQRPAGAISADIRANLTTRLCLRVLEEPDSTDTIGTAAAARLPAVPGRAILRTETTTTFQSAWCGDSGAVAALVDQVGAAARELMRTEPWRADLPPPWAPALPQSVPVSDLAPAPPGRDPGPASGGTGSESSTGSGTSQPVAVPWLRTDLPSEQRLGVGYLELPARLIISGPPGSGRTTAASTLAHGAARHGITVHALADSPLLPATAPSAGTWCPPTDPRRARRLLTVLQQHRSTDLLIVDDVDNWNDTLDELSGPGAGTDLLQTILRQSRRTGLSLVLTTTSAAHRWAAQAEEHLVLTPRDPADAAMAGVPKELIGTGWPPGRGVLLTARQAVLGQVALAGARAAAVSPWPAPAEPPLRLQPLPEYVDSAARPPTQDRVWLGIGGDAAEWIGVALPPGSTWLILGPGGSGRSATLGLVAEQLHAQGRTDVLIIDDADRIPPARLADLETRITDPGLTVIGVANPERLQNTYHAVGARLRQADVTVALGAVDAHLAGADIRSASDPTGPVGRAVLIDGARVTPLQLATGRPV